MKKNIIKTVLSLIVLSVVINAGPPIGAHPVHPPVVERT